MRDRPAAHPCPKKQQKKREKRERSGTCRSLTRWMINLRQRFYFSVVSGYFCIWVWMELLTSLPYHLNMNPRGWYPSVVSVLGLCKSLMSLLTPPSPPHSPPLPRYSNFFKMKARISSNNLPEALDFCVFSCGKDKR